MRIVVVGVWFYSFSALNVPLLSPAGLPVSTYAKFCHRKLQKVAITGGKKVSRKSTNGIVGVVFRRQKQDESVVTQV